jgi:uncharacterized integral membrane protein
MKFVSWLATVLVLLLALCFALSNRQSVTASLWPFGVEIEAPLFLFSLGMFFGGLLLGAVIGWLSYLPHRLEARRLRNDIAGLRGKIEDLQHMATPQNRIEGPVPPPKSKWRFWETES